MRTPIKTVDDFEPGDRVLYVPNHAHGDRSHKDCEAGTVSSKNSINVFVRFDESVRKFGWDEATSQACRPGNLEKDNAQ